MRTICFANKLMPDKPCGGGAGVLFRLYKANSIHRLIDNITFVFLDKVIIQNNGEQVYNINSSSEDETYTVRQLMQYYEVIIPAFGMNDDDVYIFHDLDSFYAFYNIHGGIKHSLVVYHGQGSLYNEALSSGMEPDESFRQACIELTWFAIEHSTVFAFPSSGAEQALIDTMPEINDVLKCHRTEILYNGCTPETEKDDGNSQVGQLTEFLQTLECIRFVSVCTLNEAKGIDLVPDFFNELKKKTDFIWILIGNGVKGTEIAGKIKRYNLSDNVIWIPEWLSNDDIIRVMKYTDFYIMYHRFSIFDFSTIEAMHMGNVPVLSPVGGNLEMVKEDSGYFLKSPDDADGFLEWYESKNINELRNKNILIADKYFSEKVFLQRYADVIETI